MNRREMLTGATVAALTMVPMTASAETIKYLPGLVKQRLAAGETVLVAYHARWCSTCAAQGRVIDALKASNPAYDQEITFVEADWDQHGRTGLARELRIPRRSTLVLLRGDQELGRLVADTREDAIRNLLDSALIS